MQNSYNSFFKFVLGFSVFIAVSLGITYAVTTYSIAQEREEQAAAAFKAMLGEKDKIVWWQFWR